MGEFLRTHELLCVVAVLLKPCLWKTLSPTAASQRPDDASLRALVFHAMGDLVKLN